MGLNFDAEGGQTSMLVHNQLAGAVEPDQMKRVLANIDTDDGKVFEASCLLCTHGYFSLLRG